MKNNGYLCVVLHAHLPYVRHPEYDDFVEERWLFEAVRESYLPLIRLLQGRKNKENSARLTLSLSPSLIAMLDDALLRERCLRYLERTSKMADLLIKKYKEDKRVHPIATFYKALAEENLKTWNVCKQDLIGAFIDAEKSGTLELITTAATHAFLPLWKRHYETTRKQIDVGVRAFKKRIGHDPVGIWLPECGFYPGLEDLLEEFGIKYFFVDTHGIQHADPRPVNGVYEPIMCKNGIAAFGRDPESSHQVWSAHVGYPGDVDYREYYRDIGNDLTEAELKDSFPNAGLDHSTGFKFHRVTGAGEKKDWYHPGHAAEKAAMHAGDFLHKKYEQARRLSEDMDLPPMIVAPYDAELFGHWWFEGPMFLEALMNAVESHKSISMITPSDYLKLHKDGHVATPAASTWGARGYHDVWLNDATAWMYPHLYRAAEKAALLDSLVSDKLSEKDRKRLVAQAHREVMMAQFSDWPFMLNAGSHLEYAEKRVRDHLSRFYWVTDALERGSFDVKTFEAIEEADNLFSDDLLV